MARPLLELVMIVRDEAASIRAVIELARTAVDQFTIIDTGSTDGTQDIIREMVQPQDYFSCESIAVFDGIKDRRIIDFSATRNKVLEIQAAGTNAAVFSLMLSGDETLENGPELRAFLETQRDTTAGAYRVMIRKGTSRWPYPRVLRVDAEWRYRFPIHEMPFSPTGETDGPFIPGVEIVYAPADQQRLFQRMKSVDLPVLSHLADAPLITHDDHLSRARALMHLAQTHENLALEYAKDEPGSPWLSHQMAAMAFYWRRADLEGDPDEMHYALFKYFDIAGKVGIFYSHAEIIERLKPLAEMDARRPEVRYLLAMHASQIDVRQGAFFAMEAVRVAQEAREKPLPYPTDDRIEWLALQIAAECAKKLEKIDRAKSLAQQGIAAGGPESAFSDYLTS